MFWRMTSADPVVFNARTAGSGPWSHAKTWEGERLPQAGDFVQVRSGHTVTYDVDSGEALRMVHVAGTLTFSREKSTLLVAGLIRIEPGETTTEGGFDCHSDPHCRQASAASAEIGTLAAPIPAGITAASSPALRGRILDAARHCDLWRTLGCAWRAAETHLGETGRRPGR
jgi:hypothetical protein